MLDGGGVAPGPAGDDKVPRFEVERLRGASFGKFERQFRACLVEVLVKFHNDITVSSQKLQRDLPQVPSATPTMSTARR
jgi:hypothetical protein